MMMMTRITNIHAIINKGNVTNENSLNAITFIMIILITIIIITMMLMMMDHLILHDSY